LLDISYTYIVLKMTEREHPMGLDSQTQKQYDQELSGLAGSQKEEMKKKTNPLFAKMHGMDEDEMSDLKKELEKVHEMQRKELAKKYGVDA